MAKGFAKIYSTKGFHLTFNDLIMTISGESHLRFPLVEIICRLVEKDGIFVSFNGILFIIIYLYFMKSIFERNNPWLHVGFWIILFVIHYLMVIRFFPVWTAVSRGIVNIIPIAALFYFNNWLINRYFEKGRYMHFAITLAVVTLLITVLRVRINLLFPPIDLSRHDISGVYSWSLGAIATNLIVILLSCVYQILKNRNESERMNLAFENEQKEAQLQSLKAQINPHFLFNTLNNIYALAVVKSDRTPATILQLSDLLRYVIYESKGATTSLQLEIEHIHKFTSLFKVRFEADIDIKMTITGDPGLYKIEPMILFPLVENCFKHCDFDTNPVAYAHFRMEINPEFLIFTTRNTVAAGQVQKDKVGGVGLSNIRKRLLLKYQGRFDFRTVSDGDIFEVFLKIPVE